MARPGYLRASGDDWQRARMCALVRDDFQCQAHQVGLNECDETKLRHLVVHHIKWRIHGGTHDLDNLVTLCNVHHIELHPHMRFDMAQKERVMEMTEKEL